MLTSLGRDRSHRMQEQYVSNPVTVLHAANRSDTFGLSPILQLIDITLTNAEDFVFTTLGKLLPPPPTPAPLFARTVPPPRAFTRPTRLSENQIKFFIEDEKIKECIYKEPNSLVLAMTQHPAWNRHQQWCFASSPSRAQLSRS